MFAYKYSFDCPLCSNKYFSNDAVQADSEPEAIDEALRRHGRCPFCQQALGGRAINVTVFPHKR